MASFEYLLHARQTAEAWNVNRIERRSFYPVPDLY